MLRNSLFVLATLTLAGCSNADATSSGSTASRSFQLANFESVALKGSDDVTVKSGPGFSVVATGPQKLLDQLDIQVDGTTLNIARKSRSGWGLNWSGGKGVRVVVTMPKISSAALLGSGDLRVESAEVPTFQATLAGSGDLTADRVTADRVELNLAGSGDASLSGSSTSLNISLAGSGDINTKRLRTSLLDISLAGSGDILAHADTSANISLIGSGDVSIEGNAKCTISKIGSGDIVCTPAR
jgi:Putative auto-transporter adhesin, head GIN domain